MSHKYNGGEHQGMQKWHAPMEVGFFAPSQPI